MSNQDAEAGLTRGATAHDARRWEAGAVCHFRKDLCHRLPRGHDPARKELSKVLQVYKVGRGMRRKEEEEEAERWGGGGGGRTRIGRRKREPGRKEDGEGGEGPNIPAVQWLA